MTRAWFRKPCGKKENWGKEWDINSPRRVFIVFFYPAFGWGNETLGEVRGPSREESEPRVKWGSPWVKEGGMVDASNHWGIYCMFVLCKVSPRPDYVKPLYIKSCNLHQMGFVLVTQKVLIQHLLGQKGYPSMGITLSTRWLINASVMLGSDHEPSQPSGTHWVQSKLKFNMLSPSWAYVCNAIYHTTWTTVKCSFPQGIHCMNDVGF